MTPLEIALLSSGGYVFVDLMTARFAYRNFEWEKYNSDGENIFFSSLFGFVWPILLMVLAVGLFISAPTKEEKRAERVKAAEEERAKRAQQISRMERELGIGQAAIEAAKPKPSVPVVNLARTVGAALGYTPASWSRCPVCTRTHAGRCAG